MVDELYLLDIFSVLVGVNSMATFANAFQKILVLRFKDNVQFDFVRFLHDVGIVVCTILFFVARTQYDENTLMQDTCRRFVELSDSENAAMTTIYSLKNPDWSKYDFSLIISVLVIQATIETISKLKRTHYLGQLITMLTY